MRPFGEGKRRRGCEWTAAGAHTSSPRCGRSATDPRDCVHPDQAAAAKRLRRILAVARRVGLVGAVRGVEQTPELAHLVGVVHLAYPDARIVHIVRDGRDVACSLLEKPWLRPQQAKSDDAGVAYGSYARFWVDPARRDEFERVSDARRAAWAWRSYVAAARSGTAIGHVHRSSVGRYRRDLSEEQLEDVLAEAGDLLRELGYVT